MLQALIAINKLFKDFYVVLADLEEACLAEEGLLASARHEDIDKARIGKLYACRCAIGYARKSLKKLDKFVNGGL